MYAVPAVPVIPRLLNVTIPLTDVAVIVPTREAPLLTVAVTTVESSLVTTAPPESFSDTCGCVVNAAPDAVPTGVRTETTWVGSDATTIALFAPSEPEVPGAGSVNVALLLAASTMVPPLRANALDEV